MRPLLFGSGAGASWRKASMGIRAWAFFGATLLAFGAVCELYGGLEIPVTAQELSEQADVIISAEVVGQRSFLRENQRGKHIYTEVTLRPLENIKGTETSTNIALEVIGGTHEGIREEVSYAPVFANGEKSVLFLKSKPYRLVAARQGKRTIRDGTFFIDGVRISPAGFARALEEHAAKRAEGVSLKSILESHGKVEHRVGEPEKPPAPIEDRAPVDVKQQPVPGSPQDAGGGTVPQNELPAIQK